MSLVLNNWTQFFKPIALRKAKIAVLAFLSAIGLKFG